MVLSGVEGVSSWQAQRTFAISRHAIVDIAQVFRTPPERPSTDRLTAEGNSLVVGWWRAREVRSGAGHGRGVAPLRDLYEPYVQVLSKRMEMPLPTLLPRGDTIDDWERSPWNLADGDDDAP